MAQSAQSTPLEPPAAPARPGFTSTSRLGSADQPAAKPIASDTGNHGTSTNWPNIDPVLHQRSLSPWISAAVICGGFIVGAVGAGIALSASDGTEIHLNGEGGNESAIAPPQYVTLRQRHSFTASRANIETVRYSPNSALVVTVGYQPRVWDARTGERLLDAGAEVQARRGAVFSADSRSLLTTGGRKLEVWDIAAKRRIHEQTFDTQINDIALSNNGQLLGVVAEREVLVLDGQTLDTRMSLTLGDGSIPTSLRFMPDDRHMVVSFTGNMITVFDAATGLRKFTPIQHPAQIFHVAASPDGQLIAVASFAETIACYDAHSGQPLPPFRGHHDRVRGICFSTDGRWLASISDDRALKLWDVSSRRIVRSIDRPDIGNYRVALSPDGKGLAATGQYRQLTLWDLAVEP